MVDPVILATAAILGAVGLGSAILAIRTPLSFRIALRNIRRARSRSALVVLGLLVATAIVSGSLVVGDTVANVNVHYAYLGYGYTDEGIYAIAPNGGYQAFPASVATAVVSASSTDPDIAGVTPMIVGIAQAFDNTTRVPQTDLYLFGSNASQSGALGEFTTLSGAKVSGPPPGGAFLDSLAAQDLNASAGDSITLFGVVRFHTTVSAVVQDDVRGGFLTAGITGGSIFVDLPTAQHLENATGQVNFIAVTNTGSQVAGVGLSSTVATHLQATLSRTPDTSGLAVHTLLQDAVNQAQAASVGLTTIFLVFGLFSIVAGAMLIVGIFTMIAEERKGEMGMLRAIGLTRRVIVLSYYFEGFFYSVGSALAGTFVGVLSGFALLYEYTQLVPASGLSTSVLLASFTYSPDSLVTAYLVGFLLTLATVAIASVRVSRLNIVRAIRDVPEPPPPIRTYTYLAYVGVVALVAGLVLFATTFRGTSDISYPILGGGLAILGTGLIASRFVKNRVAFTVVGVGLLIWAGLEPLQNLVLGTSHTGGIFVIFVQGIMMVGGALMVVAFNGPSLANALERIGTGRHGSTPVTRIGLSYPSRRGGRTAVTLAIFALVLFTIVLLATYSATLTGNLNNSLTAQSGGYTFFGKSAQPIPDLPGKVAANSTLAPLYSNVVPIVAGQAYLTVKGFGSNPFLDGVYAAPTNASASSDFYATNQFPFYSTYQGLSASAVMTRLSTDGSVAVVDNNYATGGNGFTSSGPHPIVASGDTVEVANPATGVAQNLSVIGVLKESIVTGIWINPVTASSLGFNSTRGYLLTLNSGVSHTLAEQRTKAAFYPYGLVLVDFASVLATTTSIISGDVGLLEVFIALGLAVGIAALGILALRAVTERRREIGMLRSIGLTRPMILRAFLLEYTFVTVLGALIGGLLGLLVVYNLVVSPSASSAGVTALYIPWENLAIVVAVTGFLATLAVISPALRAARLPPAEALRGVQ
jgi:putative ABC transport system permease protein